MPRPLVPGTPSSPPDSGRYVSGTGADTVASNSFTHITNRAVWVNEYQGGPFPGAITVSGNSFDATGWTSPDWSPAGVVMTAGGEPGIRRGRHDALERHAQRILHRRDLSLNSGTSV